MIKSIINEEIEDVPSKTYSINKTNKDDRNSTSTRMNKRKNPEIINESNSSKVKKQKISAIRRDSSDSLQLSQDIWRYDPVDIIWQQERANVLRLDQYSDTYVSFKEPRDVSVNTRFTRTHTTKGDGNCFFRAVSMYLTGRDTAHGRLRTMVIDHMKRNSDRFMEITRKNKTDFNNYLKQKYKTSCGDTSNWADENIILATSSLLKTPIVCYAPQTIGKTRRCVWYEVKGVDIVDDFTVYCLKL